jgi:hypothetical protein
LADEMYDRHRRSKIAVVCRYPQRPCSNLQS